MFHCNSLSTNFNVVVQNGMQGEGGDTDIDISSTISCSVVRVRTIKDSNQATSLKGVGSATLCFHIKGE